jgi:uracil-DNA glycosylase family 4
MAKQVIPGVGNLNAKALILGAYPGAEDNETGVPFSGASGELLKRLLTDNLGFNVEEDFFITNSVMCSPPEGHSVTQGELNNCFKNLEFILSQMPNLQIVVTFGRLPLRQIEGKESVLSLRQGSLGRVTINPMDHLTEAKTVYTLALKNPSYIMRLENSYGEQRAYKEYISQLNFLRDVYDNIDATSFDYIYDYSIIESEKDAWDFLDFMMSGEVSEFGFDFETTGIRPRQTNPIMAAFSWEERKAVVLPLLYCFDNTKETYVHGKKGFLLPEKYKFEPVFSPEFEQAWFEKARPLFDSEVKTGWTERPDITVWNFQFEDGVFRSKYGYPLVPTQRQLELAGHPDVIPADGMTFMRLANSTLNSMSLDSVLHWTIPVEAETKAAGQRGVTTSDLEEYGFGSLSRFTSAGAKDDILRMIKDYDELEKEEKKYVDSFYDKEHGVFFYDDLVERACFDADVELRLAKRAGDLVYASHSEATMSGIMRDHIRDLYGW